MTLTIPSVLIFLGCLFAIFIICKILTLPLKWIIRLIGNSILGAIILFIINLVGAAWGIHIGINFITALVVGILGIPGVLLLLVLQFFF